MKQTKKMCTFAKRVELEIEGKAYALSLDFGTAIDYQLETGEEIMSAFDKLANGDLMALCNLLAVMVKDKETGKSVGMDFVKQLDVLNGIDYLTDKILETMGASVLPANENEKK